MTTAPLPRLVSAEEYDAAPVGTIVEFDRRPGALGYRNWDYLWEISDDPKDHDYAAVSVSEHEGPSTVVRWGQDSTSAASTSIRKATA